MFNFKGINYFKFIYFLIAICIFLGVCYLNDKLNNSPIEPLKEFKDGVQNHLVWSIKGECFFVRPHSDVTVYLVRVNDCDRK